MRGKREGEEEKGKKQGEYRKLGVNIDLKEEKGGLSEKANCV